MSHLQEYKPTEGEEYLEDFLIFFGFKYEAQKRISNLKNDTKQYRTADFYLPKYKMYVEFFGLWNNSGNDDYKLKKEIYRQNKIPCVYIYPENLGILEFTFDKRIQIELEKYNLHKELHAYKVFKFKKTPELKDRISYIVLFITFIAYLVFSKNHTLTEYILTGVLVIMITYQTNEIVQLYLDIFKRNKFSLGNL